MLLKTSRLRAIINNVARIPNLKNQNRMLWNKEMISDGLEYLNKSAGGNRVSEYHLRAGICAYHALAKDYESTDWEKIISLYDQYIEITDSLDISLERIDVIFEAKGPRAGIDALIELDPKDGSDKSKMINARLAEIYIKLNQYGNAIDHLSTSRKLSDSKKERDTYLNRIEFCKRQISLTRKYEEVLSF